MQKGSSSKAASTAKKAISSMKRSNYFAVSMLATSLIIIGAFILCMQLNFARFRRQLKGFKKTTPNTQVIGFTEDDSHQDVIRKAAQGLGINCDLSLLSLICSNGLNIEKRPWTSGKYIEHHGGNQNRGKKAWGIYIPDDNMELNTEDSVRHNFEVY